MPVPKGVATATGERDKTISPFEPEKPRPYLTFLCCQVREALLPRGAEMVRGDFRGAWSVAGLYHREKVAEQGTFCPGTAQSRGGQGTPPGVTRAHPPRPPSLLCEGGLRRF